MKKIRCLTAAMLAAGMNLFSAPAPAPAAPEWKRTYWNTENSRESSRHLAALQCGKKSLPSGETAWEILTPPALEQSAGTTFTAQTFNGISLTLKRTPEMKSGPWALCFSLRRTAPGNGVLRATINSRNPGGGHLAYRSGHFPLDDKPESHELRVQLTDKCASVVCYLLLNGTGGAEIVNPRFIPVEPKAFQARLTPSVFREKPFSLPEFAPGIVRINISGDPAQAEKLRLTLRLPRGFKLIDTGWNATFAEARPLPGGGSEYLIRPGTRAPHYTMGVLLILDSEFLASNQSYPASFRLDVGEVKGTEQNFFLKVLRPVGGKTPRGFLTFRSFDPLLNSLGESGEAGVAAWINNGFNAVPGSGSIFSPAALPEGTAHLIPIRTGTMLPRKPEVCHYERLRNGGYFEALPTGVPAFPSKRPGRWLLLWEYTSRHATAIRCLCPRCRAEWGAFDPTLPPAELNRKSGQWLSGRHSASLARFRGERRKQLLTRSEEILKEVAEKNEFNGIPVVEFSIADESTPPEAAGGLAWAAARMYGAYPSRLNRFGSFHALGLIDFLAAEQLRKESDDHRSPKWLALPRAIPGEEDGPTPEELQFELLGYFVAGFAGAQTGYPSGSDQLWDALIAEANRRISNCEKIRFDGKPADSRCGLELIKTPPPPRIPGFFDENGVRFLNRAEVERSSPVQFRSWELNGEILAAIGNFSETTPAEVKLKVNALPGIRKKIEINGKNRGTITPAEAKKGIPLSVPPLSWLLVKILK